MKSGKKRVYSLLSSVLIFSSFGYVSGMEKSEKTTTIKKFLKIKTRRGQSVQPEDESTDPKNLALMKLVHILHHFFAKLSNTQNASNKITTPVGATQLALFTARSRSEKLRKIVSDINLTEDEFKELDIWHKAFVRVQKQLIFIPNDSDKQMFTFLYQLRDLKLKLEGSKYILCCNEAMNESKNGLPSQKRKLGYELQQKINEAMNKILKILAPKTSWTLEINIFDLTDAGVLEVDGTKFRLNLQED